ncbi:MAG: acylphosphatase [Candidatus Helarchaeota archaeon]
MLKRIHVYISGRVQGVAFRWVTEDVARQLGVVGWVRNLRDGRVEVLAEAPEDVLKEFIKFLKRGPRYARVTDIQIEWLESTGEFRTFEIRF